MTNKEIYMQWAPIGKKWVDWVRPVAFVQMPGYTKKYNVSKLSFRNIEYVEKGCRDTAVIVDLPGVHSIEEGLSLAKYGYRPIPIYNGTIEQEGARATVDNQSVGVGLALGAVELAKIELCDDAPPAFLTDSNRLHQFRGDLSLFDNSWDVYHQDLPSAEYFLNNGIKKIVVVGDSVAKDLKKILYGFQKKKIEIFWTKGYEMPKKISIKGVKNLDNA